MAPLPACPICARTIADYVSRTRKVPVSSQEVVVVPGGKPIIFFTYTGIN